MTIDQEKELISIMIKIYEDGNKVDLSDLKNYAFKRIEFCPRKEEKTFCSSCPIHCYQKTYRQQIREVMKYSVITLTHEAWMCILLNCVSI